MSHDLVPKPDRFEGISPEWRRGSCYPMAIALSDRLGWPIKALVVDVQHGNSPVRPHVVHAWVRSPDGDALDGGGFLIEAELHETYLAHTTREWKDSRILEYADGAAFLEGMDGMFSSDFEWEGYRARLPALVERALQAADEHLVGPAPAMAPEF